MKSSSAGVYFFCQGFCYASVFEFFRCVFILFAEAISIDSDDGGHYLMQSFIYHAASYWWYFLRESFTFYDFEFVAAR